jgi:hypothetical protein
MPGGDRIRYHVGTATGTLPGIPGQNTGRHKAGPFVEIDD